MKITITFDQFDATELTQVLELVKWLRKHNAAAKQSRDSKGRFN